MLEFVDSKIMTSKGHNKIHVNNACGLTHAHGQTGGMCASHYVFDDVEFIGADPEFYTKTRDGGSLKETDVLIYYNDRTLFDESQSHPTFNLMGNGCTKYGDWNSCSDSMGIRIVRIYSPDRGPLAVKAKEGSFTISFRDLKRFMGFVNHLCDWKCLVVDVL